MSQVTRKPVFGICDQVRLKPACSATETSYSLEILDIVNIGFILSKQRNKDADQSDQVRFKPACAATETS